NVKTMDWEEAISITIENDDFDMFNMILSYSFRYSHTLYFRLVSCNSAKYIKEFHSLFPNMKRDRKEAKLNNRKIYEENCELEFQIVGAAIINGCLEITKYLIEDAEFYYNEFIVNIAILH